MFEIWLNLLNIYLNICYFQCNASQFTCDAGNCIEIEKRCNKLIDCEDKSDESFCSIVNFGESYSTQTPPRESYLNRTKFEVDLNIERIENINELDYSFTCRVIVTIKWIDGRLSYNNLFNGYTTIGKEEFEQIWKPSLILKNSLEHASITKNDAVIIQILKQNEGILKSKKELREGMTYDGKTNDIVLTAVFDTDFGCSYQLHDYPFDSQVCTIDVSSPSDISNDIVLVPGIITYSGLSNTLPQFKFNIGAITSNENGTLIQGTIQLKRIPFYHILCTYLPTVCILLMAMATLYVDESHFESTIMVSLTAMLVLYTLFQSISNTMPPTAYVKFLDVWLIFCLIMPFLIFIIEVTWELIKENEKNEVKKMYPLTKPMKDKCKLICQIGIPVLCGLFSISYVLSGIFKHYTST